MKTLIVARTKAGKQRCIGGIAVGTNGYRSVRLMNPDNFFRETDEQKHRGGGFWSKKHVPFQIGDIWDLEIEERKDIKPPHVEDVVGKRYITQPQS